MIYHHRDLKLYKKVRDALAVGDDFSKAQTEQHFFRTYVLVCGHRYKFSSFKIAKEFVALGKYIQCKNTEIH